MNSNRVAVITGAAQRIGAAIARFLHRQQINVVIHYNQSQVEAQALADELNAVRDDSAVIVQGDLCDEATYTKPIKVATDHWGRLDILVNNASLFLHAPFAGATLQDWDLMFGANSKACYFLSQAAAPWLLKQHGCIVNIGDIYAQVPKFEYSIYSMTKAVIDSMTKSLAQELAPHVRVNAIAPGPILKANTNIPTLDKPIGGLLAHEVTADDIAHAVYFAIENQFMTGEIIAIDGGKRVNNLTETPQA